MRPVRYNADIGERIMERLANGETTTEICRDPSMPTYCVLKRWERDSAEFARKYDIARRQCCEYLTDEIIMIADDATNDFVQRANGKVVYNRESFERSRLRVDTRKWLACKTLRYLYGERSEVEVRTPEGLTVRHEERSVLIDALMKLVSPKADGRTRPDDKPESRER